MLSPTHNLKQEGNSIHSLIKTQSTNHHIHSNTKAFHYTRKKPTRERILVEHMDKKNSSFLQSYKLCKSRQNDMTLFEWDTVEEVERHRNSKVDYQLNPSCQEYRPNKRMPDALNYL